MFKPIRWIILIYGMLCALFYGYQQHFYFRPKKVDPAENYDFSNAARYKSVKLPLDKETVIDVVQFSPKDDSVSKGVILFFHGNRYNVKHYAKYAPYFTSKGYECWMPDYPGYGRSSGEMTVDNLQAIAIELYKMARAKYPIDKITIYGKSLGTGVAAYLASARDCKALVLETPYKSITSLTRSYLFFMPLDYEVKYKMNTYAYLENVNAPVTILHGDKDELIPLINAAALMNVMRPTDAFYVIKGGAHNTLPAFDAYHKVLDSVLAK